jgi:hypothetical protein
MLVSPLLRITRLAPVFAACLFAQAPQPPGAQGLPPRVAPGDYQAQAKAGAVTIAADFVRHSVPTASGPLTSDGYVAVELGLYGPADARMTISMDDFSLRINGKKAALPAQPFGLVVPTLKDPEWIPPEQPEKSKSKGGITGGGGGGGGGQQDSGPPPEVKIPIEVQRAMAQRTQKAALPLGDRALPQAGVIFFQYRGKAQGIDSVELLYSGSAGKATLKLQP